MDISLIIAIIVGSVVAIAADRYWQHKHKEDEDA